MILFVIACQGSLCLNASSGGFQYVKSHNDEQVIRNPVFIIVKALFLKEPVHSFSLLIALCFVLCVLCAVDFFAMSIW